MTGLGQIGAPARKASRADTVDCVFRVVRNCGTIRLAEQEVLERAKAEIRKAKVSEASSDAQSWMDLSTPSHKTSNKSGEAQNVPLPMVYQDTVVDVDDESDKVS